MAGSGIPAFKIIPQRKYQRMLLSPLLWQGEGMCSFVLIKIFYLFPQVVYSEDFV
jgi:hypothetical protein